ncbi:hypothetical protein J6590_069246 [Homalodisca vitripennis]|nr:hypothetical protein J6590_069246 [Homalodisca vitripennis]
MDEQLVPFLGDTKLVGFKEDGLTRRKRLLRRTGLTILTFVKILLTTLSVKRDTQDADTDDPEEPTATRTLNIKTSLLTVILKTKASNHMPEWFLRTGNHPYRDSAANTRLFNFIHDIQYSFQESENGTEVLEPLLRVVRAVSGKVQAKERLPPNFNPIEFLPADRSTFFRYQGSLTTPPCSETVKWTVMQSKVPISSDQIKTFRQVSSESGKLEHNYRRLQEINKRDVYLLSDNGACATSAALSVTLFSVFVVLLQYR